MAEFEHLEELVIGLYDRGAIRFSNFQWTLKSGRRSPLFYNQRPIPSFNTNSLLSTDAQRRIRDLAIDGYSNAIDKLELPYNHLYGIPQSLTALGGMVAYRRGDSMLWGRVGSKEYGIHEAFEGDVNIGDAVISVDDVVTNAASKLETADEIEKKDLQVAGFVVMFDREEGGSEAVRSEGYSLVTVTGLSKAMAVLREEGRIGTQEFDWVQEYHEGLEASGIQSTFSGLN